MCVTGRPVRLSGTAEPSRAGPNARLVGESGPVVGVFLDLLGESCAEMGKWSGATGQSGRPGAFAGAGARQQQLQALLGQRARLAIGIALRVCACVSAAARRPDLVLPVARSRAHSSEIELAPPQRDGASEQLRARARRRASGPRAVAARNKVEEPRASC